MANRCAIRVDIMLHRSVQCLEDRPKANYILQENGDLIALEDGTGYLLMENQVVGSTSSPWLSLIFAFAIYLWGFYNANS